jgi:hypothetical protein
MNKSIAIIIAIWTFFMTPYHTTVPFGMIAHFTGLEFMRNRELILAFQLLFIGFYIAFVRQSKVGGSIVLTLLSIATLIISKSYIVVLMTRVSSISGEPYPLRTYISLPIFILINLVSIFYILKHKNNSNQRLEPIVTTPVDEVEAQSTQAHP